MAKSISLFVLSCLHTAYYAPPLPRMGEHVYCAKCNKSVCIAKVPCRYETKCRDCSRGNHDYGDAFVTAETRAVGHASRHAGHRVTLWKDGVQIADYTREVLKLESPNF
jgi:hypothetical protein